jgi:hypothetical protein
MAGIPIQGNTSGNIAEVTSNNQLEVNMPLTSSQAGFVSLVTENDPGTFVGTPSGTVGPRFMRPLYASIDNRLTVGQTTPLFDYQFTSTAQDTNFWYYKLTTMTTTQSGGFLTLNANSTATTATGTAMQTWRYFKVMANAELYMTFAINITYPALANQIAEFGLFLQTVTTLPVDGVYFRLTSAGLFGVQNNSGTELATSVFNVTITPGTTYQLGINITQYQTEFWMNNALLGTLPVPVGNVQPFATTALPLCIQQRNSAAVGGGSQMQLKVGSVRVEQDDVQLGAPFSHLQSAEGLAYQMLPGGAGQTGLTNYTNLVTYTATGLSNSAAPAQAQYLGGFLPYNPTLTANNDGILFSYQNPVGGVSQIPRTLVITGIQLHGIVTSALTGGPVTNIYTIAYGNTAIALSTAQSGSFVSGTAKAIRTVTIGMDTYAVTAAAGVLGTPLPISSDFSQSPIVVNPGEYVALMIRNIGTVTSGGVITVSCTFKHYWI